MSIEEHPELAAVDIVDARIDEQLSILGSIDAQVADRAANVESGDLDREDFRGWLVRAMDKRAVVAGTLAELRHRRHTLAGEDVKLRRDRARLSEDVVKLKARIVQVEAETARQVASVHKMYEVDGAKAMRVAHADELRRKNVEAARLREATWTAKLDGEAALLNPEHAATFLRRTWNGVPPAFRDAYCVEASRHNKPLPRSVAECLKGEDKTT